MKLYKAKCLRELDSWEFLRFDLYWDISTDYILNSLKVMMQLRWRIYMLLLFSPPESASIEISTRCSTRTWQEWSLQRQPLKSFLFDRIHKANHCNNFSDRILVVKLFVLLPLPFTLKLGLHLQGMITMPCGLCFHLWPLINWKVAIFLQNEFDAGQCMLSERVLILWGLLWVAAVAI